MTRTRCSRGLATFAMKNAIGSAITMSTIVTSSGDPDGAQGHRLVERPGERR